MYDKPIKQSPVVVKPKTESLQNRELKKSKQKKKVKTESAVHGDSAFEKTLMELDDDSIFDNIDFPDLKAKKDLDNENGQDVKSSNEKFTSEPQQGSSKGNSPDQPLNKSKTFSGSTREPSTDKTPKKTKTKIEHTDSGIDPDQEAHEKRIYSAMLYQKYKNRGGPKMHGQKQQPKGKPDCLKNLTFIKTGVLESLESDEFVNIIAEHGGRTVKAISKKVNYVVVGDEPGPAKLEKARSFNIPEISEDELFDLILVKSGQKPEYVLKSTASVDSGGCFEEATTAKEVNEKKRKISTEVEEKKDKKINLNKLNVEEKITKNKDIDNNKSPEKSHEKSHTTSTIKSHKTSTQKSPTEKVTTQNDNKKTESFATENKNSVETFLPWTEKYKPQNVKEIIGQQGDGTNVAKLKKWLLNWHKNQIPEIKKKIIRPSPWAKFDDGAYFKAALLSGPPGVGKTTTATLVSKELGFDIVDFNASDTRSKKLLQEEVAQILKTTTIAGFAAGKATANKKRVLIMDEVDGMAGNEDRGGIQELINLIKTSNVPIICMCNDRNHQKMRSLVNYCFDLKFTPPKINHIQGAMMSICFKEGLNIPLKVLIEIIAGTGCDIRQTLNNLTMYAASEENNTLEDVQKKSQASKKDTVLGPWEVVRAVFTPTEGTPLAEKTKLFFYDYSLGPLFVQENYLAVTPNCSTKKGMLKRVAQAADAISRGDLIDAKIRSTNSWSLLDCQAIYSSVLPGHYMSGKFTNKINFPSWLGKNSARNKRKRLLSELYAHTRACTSGNICALKLDYLTPLRNAIITPMIKNGTGGVNESVDVMQRYNLLREDLNSLLELCQWGNNKNPFSTVDAKVKAAFTRAFNKSNHKMAFSAGAAFSKKKTSRGDEDYENNYESETDEDDNDDVNADSLIKVKVKKSAESNETKKGSSSKTKEASKGKGKGKGKTKK
ncbi:unnamed protein product [Phyllotreta striolata]|uniref:Replication factor C subunit 1 n=1 Tax=Phyllotreta striolata TaxID=444603 RepID=A0A9N9TCY9_PHYSR|nr:unnamed protein product [Phyllotreta striolata]